ncbi:MAG: ABC-F family ATP-binding cassette domain-containing protein [Candidatus Omnitrophica bacterium]|nr:ABC-F family ATP-binding cassette domain-containing protein [Candidatus Omnitrophota bacterium]
MITINNITMGFTKRTLFKDVTLSIFPKEKIGLSGPNGAGKTTLFSIILGKMEPLAGNVQIQKSINIGYLPQEAKFDSKKTVMEELTEGDDRIRKFMEEKRRLEDTHKADTDRYGDVLHELEQLGIYEVEHKAEKILMGLGFKTSDFHRPIVELSGGWKMRTLLAKMLTYPYDLLLLDEPTNYLDLNATLWLKDFLANYQGAFVLISHDRVFLNDVTNYTIILEGAQMTKVKGNYDTYEQQKGIQQKSLERRKKVVDKKRQQLERFTQRFHAQPNRAAAVRNKRKMIEKLENIELARDEESIKDFEFSEIKQSGYMVAHLSDIGKSYGDNTVYENLDLEIVKGQKICLVGPNGAGKSTLLKMLAGDLKADSGKIKYGHQVDIGYFSQTRLDVLNPNRTAFDEVSMAGTNVPALKVRSLLGLFNYRGDDVFKHVKVLSGGEKSRLILAKLLIDPPNFMLLDEPTTHLDIDGVTALTIAFRKYEGTVCFISHDLYFIREIADCIVDVSNGKIKIYSGGLEYYLDKKKELEEISSTEKRKQKSDQKLSKKEKQKKYKEGKENRALTDLKAQHKQALKRMAQIKNEIKKLEKEQKDLETESYVKSRHLSKSFDKRSPDVLKEYGRRLKVIQTRSREIESTIKELKKERDRISK